MFRLVWFGSNNGTQASGSLLERFNIHLDMSPHSTEYEHITIDLRSLEI